MSEQLPVDSQSKMVVFGAKQIRRIWHEEQWFFSVVDIIGALTDSDNPRNYWNMMKARERKQSEVQLSTFCVQLKLPSSDGKSYKTDCVNVEAAFRVIQSIPSPKAEPFKRWLAKVGYERVQEIENPELAQTRMRELYHQKGYPDDWIQKPTKMRRACRPIRKPPGRAAPSPAMRVGSLKPSRAARSSLDKTT